MNLQKEEAQGFQFRSLLTRKTNERLAIDFIYNADLFGKQKERGAKDREHNKEECETTQGEGKMYLNR